MQTVHVIDKWKKNFFEFHQTKNLPKAIWFLLLSSEVIWNKPSGKIDSSDEISINDS